MSKKKINIALIMVVLGLWGTVAYKAVSQYFFSNEIALNDAQGQADFNISKIEKDTFKLETISRDPFLNKSVEPAKPTIPKPALPKKMVVPQPRFVKPKIVIMWPEVHYYGYIKSKEKKDELIMVKIGSKLYKLRKNDQIDGLFIKKVYNDSVEVFFNKEKKMVHLAQ
ncbi:hypothetical protein [Flavobacterium sp.]|uniref:hypothetical protein n=1 Tax=Flavobacterium sp. TaxID=239 RepID=UPI003D6C0EC8